MRLSPVLLIGFGAVTAHGDATRADTTALWPDGPATDTAPVQKTVISTFDLKRYPVSPKTYLDRCSALALAGGALALQDAGITTPPENAEQFGVVLGTHLGCLATMKSFWDKALEKGTRSANPILFSHSYFNSPISLCAIEWGLKGYHTTICAGINSGLEAVRAAHDAIALGHANAMLCGGVEALTAERYRLEPQAADTPTGEASVFFVLESAEHATARGVDGLPLEIGLFEGIKTAALSEIAANFGQCGGAHSALALARQVLTGSVPTS